MIGNNNPNSLSGSPFLLQMASNHQSTQKASLSQAQIFQDEQEIAAILHNKELELQKQLKLQEDAALQVSFKLSFFKKNDTARINCRQNSTCLHKIYIFIER